MYCAARREGDGVVLELSGEWRMAVLGAIEEQLSAVPLGGVQRLEVRAAGAHFDISAAWLLSDYLARVQAAGVPTRYAGEPPAALALLGRTLAPHAAHETATAMSGEWLDPAAAVEDIGRRAVRGWQLLESALEFLGRVSMAAVRGGFAVRH